MQEQTLVSLSGNPIYTYQRGPNDFKTAVDEFHIDLISNHIEEMIGPTSYVFQEIIADTVHIDIHHVAATKERPYHVLVTSGMSDLPMHLPTHLDTPKHLELMIVLPEYWKISADDFKLETWYWPIRQLKFLARFPHKYNSWLGWGHTIPNNEPAEPFADNTQLSSVMLMPSMYAPSSFHQLEINHETTIHFLSLMPLFKQELDYKLRHGPTKLLDKFKHYNIDDMITPNRKSCIRTHSGILSTLS